MRKVVFLLLTAALIVGSGPAGGVLIAKNLDSVSEALGSRASAYPGIGKVTYWKEVDGYYRIFMMDLDGSNQEMINTGHSNHDFTPDIANDGSRVAFVNADALGPPHTPKRICVYHFATGDVDTLVDNGLSVTNPRWSPDDGTIAFRVVEVSGDPSTTRPYLMNADGTDIRPLMDTDLSMGPGNWSLDGSKLALGSNSWVSTGEAYYYDFDSDLLVQLTYDGPYPAPSLGPYAWSPSGGDSLICENAPFSELRMLDLCGTVIEANHCNGYACWAPNGRILYADYDSLGVCEIFSMKPDGSDKIKIPNTENAKVGDAQFFNFICGDADGTGIVNISDPVYLISYIFGGGQAPVPLVSGDANCDGIVNISDVVYLIAYIFGGGPEPCAECP
jgi:hypothetical protein